MSGYVEVGPKRLDLYTRDEDRHDVDCPAIENLRVAAGKRDKAVKLIERDLAPELPRRCGDALTKALNLLRESDRQERLAFDKIEHVGETATMMLRGGS